MAEAILRKKLKELAVRGVIVFSRRACVNDEEAGGENKISQGAINAIQKFLGDIDLMEQHRARSFTREELQNADMVIAMTGIHKKKLLKWPEARDGKGKAKVYTLGELSGHGDEDIADPFMKSQEIYDAVFKQISNRIEEMLKILNFLNSKES